MLESPALPWSKAEKAALACWVTGLLATAAYLLHPWYDALIDSATYLGAAYGLIEGEGYSYLGSPFRLRPPGYSLLLAPIVATGGTNFLALNLLAMAAGVGATVLFYLVLRARIGRVLALICASMLWLNPAYQRMCNQIMSETTGLLLLFGVVLLERWCARRRSWKVHALLGLVIGLTSYVRSIQVLLLPSIIAARWLDRRRDDSTDAWSGWLRCRLIPLVGSVALVLLPWSIRNRTVEFVTPADQTLHFSYSAGLWHQDSADPRSPRLSAAQVLERVPLRARQIANGLGSRLQTRQDRPVHLWIAVPLVLCLLAVAIRRREPLDFFAIASLAVVAIYFGYDNRLLLPAYCLAMAAALECMRGLASFLMSPRAALAVVAALGTCAAVADFRPRHGWEELERRHRDDLELAREVEGVLPPDARLGARRGFTPGVYLGRPVFSLDFAVLRQGKMDAVEEVIDRYGLNTILLDPSSPAEAPYVRYFRQRYPRVEPVGRGWLVRVRP